MQLHLYFFWWFTDSHEDAHWGEALHVQPMQQSFRTKEQSRSTFQNSHDLDSDCKSNFEVNE